MNEDQSERYAILLQTKGNKDYLFADDPYVSAGSDYLKYDIPGEALTDSALQHDPRGGEISRLSVCLGRLFSIDQL
mgnify:FL=1